VTPTERHEALVKYALEAFDSIDVVDMSSARFEERVRERMAQAAQLWTDEVDEADGATERADAAEAKLKVLEEAGKGALAFAGKAVLKYLDESLRAREEKKG